MENTGWEVEVLLKGSWRGATSALVWNGRHRIVADTGMPHEAPQLFQALAARGIQAGDVTAVVNTHFHIDHVLNNALFPKATIYATQESYAWGLSLYADLRNGAEWERLVLKYYPETFEYEKAAENMGKLRRLALRWWDVSRLGPLSRYRWLETHPLPDGLEHVLTSGHVPGHATVVVPGEESRTVIAGDALLCQGDEARVLTMIPHNREGYHHDRTRILSLGRRILPGHGQEFVVS